MSDSGSEANHLRDAITEEQRAASDAKVLAGQREALELALHGAALGEVLAVLVRTVESQSSQNVVASILLLEQETGRLRHGAGPSLHADYNKAIDGIQIGPAVGSCGTAAFTKKVVVVSDIQTDPLWAEFKGLAGQFGLRACWSMPFFSSQGQVLGTFALYHRTVATPTPLDRRVADLLAHTAAIVVERELESRRRAEAEERLRRAKEAQLRRNAMMFEHAPAAIAVLRGPEHVFDLANPRYIAMIGGRDVIGKPLRAALPEVVGQGLVELLDNVRRTGEPYIGSAQRVALARGANGAVEEGFFDFVYQPIPDSADDERAILVIAFDVTALVRSRIEAETAKHRAESSEQALATFIDNLPELAWTARPDGHIDYFNRRWYDYTGHAFDDVQGWGWQKLHDSRALPMVLDRWRHSLATGEPFEMEHTLRGGDGIARWFLTRVVPTRDAAGTIVRWFGTSTNIDAIKASYALAEAMAEQSRDTQRALLELRAARDEAEGKLARVRASAGMLEET